MSKTRHSKQRQRVVYRAMSDGDYLVAYTLNGHRQEKLVFLKKGQPVVMELELEVKHIADVEKKRSAPAESPVDAG